LLLVNPEVNSGSVTVVPVVIFPGMVPFTCFVTVNATQFPVVMAEVFSSAMWIPDTVPVVMMMLVIVVRTMCFNSSGC
jgi:hypothetical protein